MVPTEVARASIVDCSPITIPGRDVLMAVEVISPGSGSERTDRVRKVREYAALGIPQYWLVEYSPQPRVQVLTLADGVDVYQAGPVVAAGATFTAEALADKAISVRFDPGTLTEF
ncbi:Uma2 family endonuclease [Actinomadura rudentiformis]|uniref:Uma2 family endonuclease n=2 Tax=Actinomadura rudentiformis TaxID=359158 RepID=A0A6H9YPG1_9ACTN|nr:Uma2 family endonuclease [Actinomadura rudentiformis]